MKCLLTHNLCFPQRTMWHFFSMGRPRTNLNFNASITLRETSLSISFPFVIGVRSSCHCSVGGIHGELLFTLEKSFLSLKAKETNCKQQDCQEQPLGIGSADPRAILQFQGGQNMEQEEHLFPLAINIQVIGGPAQNKDLLMMRKEYTGMENIWIR